MKSKKTSRNALIVLMSLGFFAITAWAVKAYQAPLGPALEQIHPLGPAGNQIEATTAAPPIDQISVCGESTAWNVLVLASDAGDLRYAKGSRLTRMLRVDFPNRKVTLYAFPHNLWVDTVGLGLTNPTIDATQLGAVFYEARSRSTSTNVRATMVDGSNATARMLAKNFLISTDHYLTIDLIQIPAVIDAIGGIAVDIPVTVSDPSTGMVLPAGQQTLNGQQFLAYARVVPESDSVRIQRNNLLLDALHQKLLDPAVWGRISEMYAQFREAIVTDLSPEQINQLACLLREVPKEAIIQSGVRQEWTSPGPQPGSLLWDKTSAFNQMKDLELFP